MDKDSPCIPLGHIQTYFDLRKSLNLDADWLQQKIQFRVDNPHEIIEHIIGIEELCARYGYRADYLMRVGVTT